MASKPGLEEDQAYNWSEKGASIAQRLKMWADLDDSQNAVLLEQLGYSLYRASMQSDSQNEFRDRIRQSIDAYQKAIPINRLSSVPSPVELARSYAINSIVALGIAYYSDQTGKDELVNRSGNAWRKALQTSEVSALLEMATQARVGNPELGVEGSEEIIAFLEKTLELVRTTMDKPTICSIL